MNKMLGLLFCSSVVGTMTMIESPILFQQKEKPVESVIYSVTPVMSQPLLAEVPKPRGFTPLENKPEMDFPFPGS